MYQINYYQADGRIGTVTQSPAGQKFETLDEAKSAVIREHGYHGEYVNEDRCICYHESEVEGCGGFEFRRVEATA